MKVNKICLFAINALFLAVSAAPVQFVSAAPPIQPLSDIQQAVISFVESNYDSDVQLNVSVKSLDKRLRLSKCMEPLSAQWASGSRHLGRVTVQVSCPSPKPWRVHVQSTVTMDANVWTLKRGVQRGDVMTKDLLVRKTVTLGAGHPSFASPVKDIEPLVGFVFSKRVGAGKVLVERMLKPAILVRKGKAVIIRHRSVGLSLQTSGVAMENAAAQQRVKVKNRSSGKIIDAIAISRDIVEIVH